MPNRGSALDAEAISPGEHSDLLVDGESAGAFGLPVYVERRLGPQLAGICQTSSPQGGVEVPEQVIGNDGGRLTAEEGGINAFALPA